jgi:hypothetical protein
MAWTQSKTMPLNMQRQLTLRDILQVQNEPGDITLPEVLYSTSVMSRSATVDVDHANGDIVINVAGVERRLVRGSLSTKEWYQKIRAVRHDFVASELTEETDEPLSSLGLVSRQTPDCIDVTARSVLELATNASGESKSMKSAWLGKRITYYDKLKKHNIAYYILIVSPDKVMFNGKMSQPVVDELCERCRVGIDIENKIADVTGLRLNLDSDLQQNIQAIRTALKQISELPLKESRGFKKELMSESLRDNTEMEDMHVSEIMRKTLEKAMQIKPKTPDTVIADYVQKLREHGTKKDLKRVVNFPFVLSQRNRKDKNLELRSLGENVSCPSELYHIAKAGFEQIIRYKPTDLSSIKIMSMSEAASGVAQTQQHNMRKISEFIYEMTEEETKHAALSGVGAKALSAQPELLESEAHSKISFDPETPTDDIEKFIKSGEMKEHKSFHGDYRSPSIALTCRAKRRVDRNAKSLEIYKWANESTIVSLAQQITDILTEISYEYKVPNHKDKWIIKKFPNYSAFTIIHCTGTHTFCYFGFDKLRTKNIDTGRLGPTLFETENYIISDWCSYSEVALEHMVKAGPYMKGLLCYLLKHFRVPIYSEGINPPDEFWMTANSLYLTFLNNKIDVEELMTANRYLHMRALQHFDADVMQFVERLPEVCRSRLTVYYLNRTIGLMRFYQERKPYRKRIRTKKTLEEPGFEEVATPGNNQTEYMYFRLRCLFHDQPVSIEQLVDSFYFGYVVSKTKGRAGDRNFKIVAKICKEHFWFTDNIVEPNVALWQLLQEPKRHCWDHALSRRLTDLWIDKMKAKYGTSFLTQLHNKIEENLASKTFLDIATLKASAKTHLKTVLVLDPSNKTGKKRINEIKEDNPEQKGKRPRVISSLSKLIREYMHFTKDKEPTYPKLLVYCCEIMHERGWVYSDLFPKDQHGGDREIHVIEIKARIIHFAVETASRTIATFMPSDSIGNPELKDKFMLSHERKAAAVLGDHITVCKSADASKWCQRHHVSKFFFVISRICKGTDLPFLFYLFFWLWTEKRIALPVELIATLEQSKEVFTTNKVFKRLVKSFWEGKDPFISKDTNLIKIEDGMFQGLPHFTSTVVHGVINESNEVNCNIHLDELGIQNVCSVIQGSDDSAMCISIKKSDKKSLLWVQACLKWKEYIAEYMSIWTSEAKSSIGTLNLVEYNSEWWVDGKIIRPTFRWVSACLTTSLTETFYERIQTFYDLITQCLESGAYTLTCSLLQMCQSELHYKMLGLDNHVLGKEMVDKLEDCCHPAAGYFPLELDYNCGITGFDFMMYYYAKNNWVSLEGNDWDMINPRCQLEYDDKLDRSLRESLRTVELRFGSTKLHKQVVEDSGLNNLQASIAVLENDPEVLYTDKGGWKVTEAKMTAKLFDRGVRSSLSSYQPTIRSFVASSYMINRPCFTVSSKLSGLVGAFQAKYTLWQVSGFYSSKRRKTAYDSAMLRSLFIKFDEYEEGYAELEKWKHMVRTVHSNIKTRGKVEFLVWESKIPLDFELISIVRRKWFHHNTVKLSNSVFAELWTKTRAHFSFLEDEHDLTVEKNKISPIVLRNLLERVETKARKLKLVDTSAKQKTLSNIMSRVLWPKVKVLHQADTPLTDVKRILNDLYLVASSPLEDEVKSSMCNNILVREESLKIRDVSLPKRLLRLKIMSEFISSRSKQSTMLRVKSLKLGVLGYFIQRQESVLKFDVDVKGKFKHVKENIKVGEWHGIIDGTSVIMRMVGSTCNTITINRMVDPLSLASSLANLLREFRLLPPEKSHSNEAAIYLDDRSNFVVHKGDVKSLFVIKIDKELQDPVTDRLLRGAWNLKVQNMTLRLKASIRDHMGREKEVTILNYSLRSSDWQPNSRLSMDVYDLPESMKSWMKSEVVDLPQLMKDIGIGTNWVKMSQLLRRLKTEKEDVIVNNININTLTMLMRKNIVKRVSDLRKAQRLRLESLLKHYKEDEKDIFIQNFKADEKSLQAFTSMTQNKEWTQSAATNIWGDLDTVDEGAATIHRELERLQDARLNKGWDDDDDSDGSISTVGSDFLKDKRHREDDYMANLISSNLDEDVLENVRELFTSDDETFHLIDERELITSDVVPAAIVFFQSVRSHLALERDHANISEGLVRGDLDLLSRCRYTGQATGIMSLACNRNLLALSQKREEIIDEEYDSDDSAENVPSSRPQLSISTARGREVFLSDAELRKEKEYLLFVLNSAPPTMSHDLEVLLKRVESELNYRSTAYEPVGVSNIKSREFLKLVTNHLIAEDEDSPLRNARTEDEKNVLTKIFIRERCEFLDQNDAISSSKANAIMASLDHDRVNNHLIESGAIALEKNIKLIGIKGDEMVDIFETKFPFLFKTVVMTCTIQE